MTLGNGIQSVDYSYTIRDWLKSVNSNQFSQTLNYDDAAVNPRFNGNIAEMSWTTAGNAGAYHFTYDHANRLTDAVTTSGPDFSEKLISYDANGNLLSLTRGTNSPIAYHYSDANKPNQLSSVTGGLAATYSYDANGNMTYDNTKGEFTYDYRNLPIKVTTNDTVIEYAYDASGQRIRKTLKNNGNTLSETIYIRGTGGNVIAEYRDGQIDHFNIYGNGLIGKLAPANRLVTINNQTISGTQTIQASDSVLVTGESIIQDEVTLEAGSQIQIADKRYYYLNDHLGSTRVVLNESGNVEATYSYYPFGKIAQSTETANSPKEKFTGKEHDDESGLDYFGARYYNADIARWFNVDPRASKYPSTSPYAYAVNNPVRYLDPDGMDVYAYGEDAQKTVDAVGKKFKNLKVSYNSETGQITATGKGKTKAEKMFLKALGDKDVKVNLYTTKESWFESKDGTKNIPISIGVYDGSEKKSDGTVETAQIFNYEQSEKVEKAGLSDVGTDAAHEILESYHGAKDDPGGTYNSGFNSAHQKAMNDDPNIKPLDTYRNSLTGAYGVKDPNSGKAVDLVDPNQQPRNHYKVKK